MLTAAVVTFLSAAVSAEEVTPTSAPTPPGPSSEEFLKFLEPLFTNPWVYGLIAVCVVLCVVGLGTFVILRTILPKIMEGWRSVFPPKVTQTVTTTPEGTLVVQNSASSMEQLAPTTAAEEKMAAHYEQQVKNLQAFIESLRQDKDDDRKEKDDSRKLLQEVLDRVQEVEQRVDEKDRVIEAKNEELRSKQQQIDTLNEILTNYRNERTAYQTKIQELEGMIKILTAQVEALTREIAYLKEHRNG